MNDKIMISIPEYEYGDTMVDLCYWNINYPGDEENNCHEVWDHRVWELFSEEYMY